MKVLVYPHTMGIGGSQLNAVEIAGAVRDRGHDVTVVSRPGPLMSPGLLATRQSCQSALLHTRLRSVTAPDRRS